MIASFFRLVVAVARAARRTYRRVARPIRLRLIDRKAKYADEHLSDLAASSELLVAWMAAAQKRRVQIEDERMRVERGLA